MKSNIDLTEISNGRIYDLNDMVRADAKGCNGCSACCHDVGNDVTLNPFDVFQLKVQLGLSFEELLIDKLILNRDDKIHLPHLAMVGEKKRCSFLSVDDRCEIHAFRPDICRLFPLGRVYRSDDFGYFLQAGACVKPKLEKVKVKKWIEISDYNENRDFIIAWYQLIKALRFRLKFVRDEEELSIIRKDLLDTFYRFDAGAHTDFYDYFRAVLPAAKSRMGVL